ncbi:hypothetical protein OH76DRAFT_1084867 [Lentinus brumalis]|uniref:Uncharacterized protein n=1 Tax=Lentinus brumalis TaxID=2498619 RepID=A0A371DP70_9APHY|nr:hypothetical protein OH76DRAFT_1084867 [Polyporus brumalis]
MFPCNLRDACEARTVTHRREHEAGRGRTQWRSACLLSAGPVRRVHACACSTTLSAAFVPHGACHCDVPGVRHAGVCVHRESRAGGWSGGRHRGRIVLGQAGRLPAMDRVHASLLDRLGKARRSGADLARPTYVPMRPRRSAQNGCHASRCGLAFSSMSTSHAILGCLQRTCTSGQTHIRPNGDSSSRGPWHIPRINWRPHKAGGVIAVRVVSKPCPGAQQCKPWHADRCGHRPTSTDRVISE